MKDTLLGPDDPAPFTARDGGRASPFVVVCDHAGNAVPRRLGTLGLPDAERQRHVAWDIGAWAVASRVATALDAFLVGQTYSRLVIDCNRPPGAPTSIPLVSERTAVPGNAGLSEAEKAARQREIFGPYHRRIAAELDRRLAAGEPTVLVAVHSFTPVYLDVARPWEAGVMHRGTAFGQIVMDLIRAEGLCVGDNEPYAITDATDYTIPVHGERRGLPHVGLEIRQDLIAGEPGRQRWAALLERLLPQAHARLGGGGGGGA